MNFCTCWVLGANIGHCLRFLAEYEIFLGADIRYLILDTDGIKAIIQKVK